MVRLRIKRGDTWRASFWWTDSVGQPIDLTGASALLQLRTAAASTPVLDVSDVTGELTVGTTDGLIELEVPAEDMADLEPRLYLCDLEVTYASNEIESTDTFEVALEPDIARPVEVVP